MKLRSVLPGASLLAALVGCRGGDEVQGPNVLLVTLSSARADRVGAYGDDQADTPNLDRLAGQGAVFLRAYTSAPATLPALASIHSGLYPPSHGLRLDGDGAMPQALPTLAEQLRDAGYHTVAVSGSALTEPVWGLDQGFDRYLAPSTAGLDPTVLDAQGSLDDAQVVSAALELLEGTAGPTFAWVHLDDARAPHEAPEPCRSEHPRQPYVAELACADAALGRLVEGWDRLFPDSVVVVTADHGVSLGEGGEPGHGLLLHDATLRVPLIVRARGEASLPSDDAERDPVSLVDIAPTVLELVGLDPPASLPGRSLFDEGSEEIYSESSLGSAAFGLAPLAALSIDDGRLVEGAWRGWYPARGLRVASDVDPQLDVQDLHEDLGRLRAGMAERVGDEVCLDGPALDRVLLAGGLPGAPQDAISATDPRDAVELAQLLETARGHVGLGRLWAADRALAALQVRAGDAWAADLLRARLLRQGGRLDEAARLAAAVYESSPSATLALQVAEAHEAAGRWERSAQWYERARAHAPECAAASAGLAHAALALGDRARAEEILAAAPVARHREPALELVEAELLLADDRPYEALELARGAVLALGGTARALSAEAAAWWALGELDEAVTVYQRALAQDRYDMVVRQRLAACLEELGQHVEAARLLQPSGLGDREDETTVPEPLRSSRRPG